MNEQHDTLRLMLRPPVAEPDQAPDSSGETAGRRFPAVDGLRGAAVLAVLLHDTGGGGRWFSWSGAGVDVLLVLSGFLTTLPLLRRATATGRTGVLGFLARRTKRLGPVVLLLSLAATLTLCQALGPPRGVRDLVRQLRSGLLGHGDTDSPLAPLWLAGLTAGSVLAWSLVLACLCLLVRRRLAAAALVAALLTGAAVVAAALGMLPGTGVGHGQDIEAVLRILAPQTRALRTHAPQTHALRTHALWALALPAGAAAACLVHLAERGARELSRRAAVLLTTAGIATGIASTAALAVSAAVSAAVRGGGGQGDNRHTAAIVVSTALLTATLCTDRGPLPRLLSSDLLTEVGRMSAALFLLHLPVYWLLHRGQPGLSPLALFLVGGATSWFLALLAHYLLSERLGARRWRPRRAVGRSPL